MDAEALGTFVVTNLKMVGKKNNKFVTQIYVLFSG